MGAFRGRSGAKRKFCPFKTERMNSVEIHYTNIPMLRKFLTDTWKIVPSRITGVSCQYQSKLAQEIKIARFLALVPYCDHH